MLRLGYFCIGGFNKQFLVSYRQRYKPRFRPVLPQVLFESLNSFDPVLFLLQFQGLSFNIVNDLDRNELIRDSFQGTLAMLLNRLLILFY